MWDVNLLTAIQSVEKSMGFVLHRFLVFLGLSAGFLFATLAGAGTAVGLGSLSTNPLPFAHFGAIAGFAAFAWLAYRSRAALFRSIRAPHLLLLTLLTRPHEAIPEGRAQVAFARNRLAESAPNPRLLWTIRQAGRAALRQYADARASERRGTGTPWYTTLIDKAQTWISAETADLMIADILQSAGANPWRRAHDQLLRVARHLPLLVKHRVALAVFEGALWFLASLLLLKAFQSIAGSLPFPTGIWPYVFAALFGWTIKASFLEPIVQAALLQIPLDGLPAQAQPDLAEKMADDSEAFRNISTRANDSAF